MDNQNRAYLKIANRIGIFLVMLFVICFLWYYIRPVEQELHLKLFRLAYFGFEDMSLSGFILGAIQTYIWAYIAVAIYCLIGFGYSFKR
jgi:hypothetical protein